LCTGRSAFTSGAPSTVTCGLGYLRLLSDAFKKFLGRFVGRILGNKATLEGPFQDALSEPGGTIQVGSYLDFDLVHDGEAALNLPNNYQLLKIRRKRHSSICHVLLVDAGLVDRPLGVCQKSGATIE
jgi:hypothetical protein